MKDSEGHIGDWYASRTSASRGTRTCGAIGLSSIAFGLSVTLLLTQIARTGPMAANVVGTACVSLGLSLFFAPRLNFARVIGLALVALIAFVANALILAVLLHSMGTSRWAAQMVALTAYAGLVLGLGKLFVVSDLAVGRIDRFVAWQAHRPWLVRFGWFAALVPSLAYIAARTVLLDFNGNDFRYFWLAGDIWAHGLNPYDINVFAARGAEVFNEGSNNPVLWPYPPWMWAISRTLAALPFAQAQLAWRLVLAAMLLASVVLLGGRIVRITARDGKAPGAAWYGIAMLFLACTMRASGESLSLGQTSHLVLLGLMLGLVALLEERRWLAVAALVILFMKPQIGLIFGLFMLGTRGGFQALAMAGTIVALLAVPPILVVGVEPTVHGFLNGLFHYGDTPIDQAVGMTGLRHLVFELVEIEVSGVVFALSGGAIAFLIGFFLYRRATDTAARSHILGLLLLVIVNFAPLHSYEAVYIMPAVLLMFGWPALVQLSIGIGLLIIYRSEVIAGATGWWDTRSFFKGTTVDSVGFLALLLVWVTALIDEHRAQRRQSSLESR